MPRVVKGIPRVVLPRISPGRGTNEINPLHTISGDIRKSEPRDTPQKIWQTRVRKKSEGRPPPGSKKRGEQMVNESLKRTLGFLRKKHSTIKENGWVQGQATVLCRIGRLCVPHVGTVESGDLETVKEAQVAGCVRINITGIKLYTETLAIQLRHSNEKHLWTSNTHTVLCNL